MKVAIFDSRLQMGEAAATDAANLIRQAIALRSHAYLIAATGASQFRISRGSGPTAGDWLGPKQRSFISTSMLDLLESHPASFRRYLRERIVDRVHPAAFHFINGDAPDPSAEGRRVGELISRQTIDAAFVGIERTGIWLSMIARRFRHAGTISHRGFLTKRVAGNRLGRLV